MKNIKQRIIAIILAVLQIVSFISPTGIAHADISAGYSDSSYYIKMNLDSASLLALRNGNYYLVIRQTDNTYSYLKFTELPDRYVDEVNAYVRFNDFYSSDATDTQYATGATGSIESIYLIQNEKTPSEITPKEIAETTSLPDGSEIDNS